MKKCIVLAFVFISFLCLLLGIYLFFIVPTSTYTQKDLDSYSISTKNSDASMEGVKAIYYWKGFLYCAKNDEILKTDDFGKTYTRVGNLDYMSTPLNCAKKSKILSRILRLDIYRLRVLKNDNVVLTAKGGVYIIDANTKKSQRIYAPSMGSRPISLTLDKDDNVYWGEYHFNPNMVEMSIFKYDTQKGELSKAYTFKPKEISHIHGVEYDMYDDCFWVATGDSQNETMLLKFSADFSKKEIITQGGQINRFFETKSTKDKVFITPDAPDGDSYLTVLIKSTNELKRLKKLDSPAFFSTILGNRFICATSNEPYAKGHCEYLNTHIYAANIDTLEVEKIGIFPTDFLYRVSLISSYSNGLFQFSNAFFPEGTPTDSSKLLIYGNGLTGFNYSTLIWDISKK